MTQNQSNPQDDDLVNFLKTYSPIPPKEDKPCEQLVMSSIISSTTSPLLNSRWLRKGWVLSGTLITTLLILGGYLFNLNTRSTPQVATEMDQLEAFMIETWYDSMAQESELNYVTVKD
ncbi:hypothetical protein [Geminocystis sp. NIES-3709]|uniref:hypothetical protein n=1 Tax=Geminocystis sp. NIES-3709 TaxID=1617448 RepID=UPI0005FC70D4|nr:hypothetical protein [Geminocystis sp. NIES-3709]BAQ63812.1 hypothetical protein GM3709_577 [Geminocystis sp. NIES-3709]